MPHYTQEMVFKTVTETYRKPAVPKSAVSKHGTKVGQCKSLNPGLDPGLESAPVFKFFIAEKDDSAFNLNPLQAWTPA